MRNKDSGGQGRGACTMGGMGCQKLLNIKPGRLPLDMEGAPERAGQAVKGQPLSTWGGGGTVHLLRPRVGTSTPVPLASKGVSFPNPAPCQGPRPSPAGARVPAGSMLSQPLTRDGTIRRQEGVPGHHPDTWDRWAGSAKLLLLTSRALPGPCPPGAGSTPPSGDNRKCLQTSPGGEGDKIGT